MTHSPALLNFLAQPDMENLKLSAYDDGTGVMTIGVGHTGPEVHAGLTWTREQCLATLSADLLHADMAVNSCLHPETLLAQNEFDALVSLAFNIGWGNIKSSTVIREVNGGDKPAAGNAFLLWNKAGGHVMAGLVKRRESEKAMFLGQPNQFLAAYHA